MNRMKKLYLITIAIFLTFVGSLIACNNKNYTINFYTQSDYQLSSINFNEKEAASLLLPTAEKQGHTFMGWFLDESLTEEFSIEKISSDNTINLYAKYSINSYTITIHDDSIKENVLTYQYDADINLPIPQGDATFIGWFLDETLSTPLMHSKMPAENLNVYPKFSLKSYTVTIEFNNDYACPFKDEYIQLVNEDKEFQPVTITPNLGYAFDYYEIDGIPYKNNPITVPFDYSDKTVKVYTSYATYELPIINIQAENEINSKQSYTDMTFSLDNCENPLYNISGGIRLRGNTTMNYPKKPYRIKFDKKQSLFGLTKAKSWVLLADYLEPSTLSNNTAFYLGNASDALEFTPHGYKVNVYLNNDYIGLYTLCEQVQENEGRMNIEMELDENDMIPTTLTKLSQYNFFLSMDSNVLGDADAINGETYFYIEEYNRYFEIKYPEKELFSSDNQFNSFYSQLVTYTKNILDIMHNDSLDEINKNINTLSLIDYFIVDNIMMMRDHEYKSLNIYHVASSSSSNTMQKLNFGPIWDYDWALNTPWTGFPNETFTVGTSAIYYFEPFFSAIKRYEQLINTVKIRYNTYFKPALEKYVFEYDYNIKKIKNSLELNRQRWYASYQYDIVIANVDFLKNFLTARKTVLDEVWTVTV